MLLENIYHSWEKCHTHAQKSIVWTSITCPRGKWFPACQNTIEKIQADNDFAKNTINSIKKFLKGGEKDNILSYVKEGFSSDCQIKILQTYLCYIERIADYQQKHSSLPLENFSKDIAASENISEGLVIDIGLSLLKKRIRPAKREIKLAVLLVSQSGEGVAALLTLELIADGDGKLYPVPELTLCRDKYFIEAEQNALASIKNVPANLDMRWSIKRQDDALLGHLTGSSIGAAFALGLNFLLNPADNFDDMELSRTGVSATIDESGKLHKVGGLWNKLSIELMQLANLHTVIVSADQDDIPPLYLNNNAEILVLKEKNISHAINELDAHTLPKRIIKKYEHSHCKYLEFRLPGTQTHTEIHYPIIPLYKITTLSDIETKTPDSSEIKLKANSEFQCIENISNTNNSTKKSLRVSPVDFDAIFNICHFFKKNENTDAPRLLFVGGAGSGKSTLIQCLALKSANKNSNKLQLLPVRIRLRDWEKWSKNHPETGLAEYLDAHYLQHTKSAPGASQWRSWLQRGDVVLLMDGLDEVDDEAWCKPHLTELYKNRKTPLIITSRTIAISQYKTHLNNYDLYWLGPLNEKQRDRYIELYPSKQGFNSHELINRLNTDSNLNELAQNPLMLSIICFSNDNNQGYSLSTKRTDLYHSIIKQLLKRPRRVDVKYPAEPPDINDRIAILAHAALQLFTQNLITFSEKDFMSSLGYALEEVGYGSAPAKPWANALNREFIDNYGLLKGSREQDDGNTVPYFFTHLTIQEYLCAFALFLIAKNNNSELTRNTIPGDNIFKSLTLMDEKTDIPPRWKMVREFYNELNEM